MVPECAMKCGNMNDSERLTESDENSILYRFNSLKYKRF